MRCGLSFLTRHLFHTAGLAFGRLSFRPVWASLPPPSALFPKLFPPQWALALSFGLVFAGGGLPALVQAETVHLTTGEAIKGRIIEVNEETIALESERGFGIIQIQRHEISLIEYDNSPRNPSRMLGIGYLHRTSPKSSSGELVEYGTEGISLKYWLGAKDALSIVISAFSSEQNAQDIYEVVSTDIRYAHVALRQGGLDVFLGASAGYVSVHDTTGENTIHDDGYTFRLFGGVELFFARFPRLGLSSEIGVGTQTVGKRRITNASTTTFPAFSVHMYF